MSEGDFNLAEATEPVLALRYRAELALRRGDLDESLRLRAEADALEKGGHHEST